MLPDFHSCFCKETSTCFSTARGSLLRETEEGRAYFKVNLVLSINEETSKTLWAVREATLIRLEPVATGCSWLGARWHPPEALQPIREGRLCALANQRSLRCCCWGKRWWELPRGTGGEPEEMCGRRTLLGGCAGGAASVGFAGDSLSWVFCLQCISHEKTCKGPLWGAHFCGRKRTAQATVVKRVFGELISSWTPISHFLYKHYQHIFYTFPLLQNHNSLNFHLRPKISRDSDYVFFHIDYFFFSITFGKEVLWQIQWSWLKKRSG